MSDFHNVVKELAVCKNCHSNLEITVDRRNGLKFESVIKCSNCELQKVYTNAAQIVLDEEETKYYDINLRLVYGLRSIGIGREGARLFCGILNIPAPPTRFAPYINILETPSEVIAKNSMEEGLQEAIELNDNSTDLAIALDGTWQKRGFSSLNGLVSATSFDTGKVIDVGIMSKHCMCKDKFQNIHEENCPANYHGSSGGMEPLGAQQIFENSKNKGVRYKYYIGDGDSKSFSQVAASKPYGNDFEIEKLECIGHVQKIMGKGLRQLKKLLGSKRLRDNKPIGGRGRLTDAAILSIQKYYGLAIRRNTDSNEECMRKAVWAEFFHLGSTDEKPNHDLCPTGVDTWCKFNKSIAENKNYEHSKHFHLPQTIMTEIKPVFERLSESHLLKKCLRGQTQNLNESFNNVVWSILPKRVFVSLRTLKTGVYQAVASFNIGQTSKCKILELLKIDPGRNCIRAMRLIDEKRVKEAEIRFLKSTKLARTIRSRNKRQLEDEIEETEGVCYEAGGF